MFMRKYNVVVREDGMSYLFEGLEAENKNAACAEAIRQCLDLFAETEIGNLCAVARLEREVA